ncbi:MAG: hypothetical protein LBS05_11280, partial [Tannerellaceae bacterium]|nr:hypothetical protein [Tannerellaceae bacterium]
MKKFFKVWIAVFILSVVIFFCYDDDIIRFISILSGLASIVSLFFCFKDDGKGGGGTNIFKTWFNFNSTVIQNNVSLDARELIKELTAEDKERIKELKELLANNNQLHGIERSKLNAEIADLEQQLKEKEAKIQEFVKYYETVDINASLLFKEAFDLFTQGKLDETLTLLDDEKMRTETTKLENETAKLEDKRKDLAATYILKAQTLDLKNNFQAAEANYLEAADIFPSGENNFQVARFYQKQNNFPAAETYYTRCLPLAKTPAEKANVLNNVAALHWKM